MKFDQNIFCKYLWTCMTQKYFQLCSIIQIQISNYILLFVSQNNRYQIIHNPMRIYYKFKTQNQTKRKGKKES